MTTPDNLDAQGNVRDDSVCQAHYDGPADPNCAECERDRLEWEQVQREMDADAEARRCAGREIDPTRASSCASSLLAPTTNSTWP
jgi:hypothetical protein